MDIELAIKLQKKLIMMHRFVYVIFMLQRVALQITYSDIPTPNTIIMLSFIGICFIIEELLAKFKCFNSVKALRICRLIQCLLSAGMVVFIDYSYDSGSIILALLIVFVIDLFLTFDITDRSHIVAHAIGIGLFLLAVLLVRMQSIDNDRWMFIFFTIATLCIVITIEGFIFSGYVKHRDEELLNERRKFENIVEKNENILNMQNKLRNTNDQLNIQKLDLQRANKQIQEANEEMKVQEEIMRYIASSFDVPRISDQITDSIMNIKKLGFCAVYIKSGIYHNKHPHFVIKTRIGNLEQLISNHIEDLYEKMVKQGEVERVIHDNAGDEAEIFKDVNINSVYFKILGSGEDTYGLFMIGDSRRNLFADNMSFYNAIIAQFDIAINNAMIYNDMQHMARKDGLTGINNRIYFNQLFKETADRIVNSNGCMSVALFDIDKFKNVNDTYGHLAGDEVIKRIATVTEECIDEHDGFVCRYGGEEFVAVLPDRNITEAEPIIQELFEKLCQQVVNYNEFEIHLSVSVGLTSYPEVCKNSDDLLKRADWSMYYAKEHGRHQLKVDDGTLEKE